MTDDADDADVERIAAEFDAFCRALGEHGEVEPEVLFEGIDRFKAAFAKNGSAGALRWVEHVEAWRTQVLGTLD